jgi:transcriptional regulator with XRE-family HTH domain
MAAKLKSPTTDVIPQALKDIADLQDTLRRDSPKYVAAERSEEAAETFCYTIRKGLRDHRKALRIDQEHVAGHLNVTQSAISKLETGAGDLSLKTLYRFSEALGLRPVVNFVQSASSVAEALGTKDVEVSTMSSEVPISTAVERLQVEMLRVISEAFPKAITEAVRKTG